MSTLPRRRHGRRQATGKKKGQRPIIAGLQVGGIRGALAPVRREGDFLMRTPISAGNWKMNKTAEEAVAFVREIRHGLNNIEGIDRVVCPPFVALPAVYEALQATKIGVGAQNMYH